MIKPLTFSDASRFHLFLFVHAAYSDFELHGREIQYILGKLKDWVPDDVDIYDEFLELKDHYETLSEAAIEEIIRVNFPRFLESDIHRKLLSWLSGVIRADGVVKESELKFFQSIKEIMEDPATH